MKIIAVDLDGTLAHHSDSFDVKTIGKPIGPMMDRVKQWLAEGHEVVIFTARIGHEGAFPHIKKWLREHELDHLRVTNVKSPDFHEIWDDKAISVEKNTGRVMGRKSEGSWDDEARKELS